MSNFNKSGYYFIIFILLSMGFVIANAKSVQQDKSRKKYIKFSHKFHIDDIGADCVTCHLDIHNSTKSSDNNLAHKESCLECHDGDTAREECEVCHYDPDEAVNFPNPVREVVFNHQNHIPLIREEESCGTCHSGLEKTDYATAANMPKIENCVTCHNNKEAQQYCESCHTALPSLRPISHIKTWIYRHDEAVRSTSEDCSMCHSFNYCQECHDGAIFLGIDAAVSDKITPYATQNWGIHNLVLTRNHDLNYRYTHALEAKSKIENCQLCHENETFCVSCHEEAIGGGTGKPQWHGGANWGAIAFGRGSGGGRHAQMAKRDISNCASCHDANGEDPTCLLCHMDRIPGRNNDLKTHTNNLYKGVKGPWHGDRSYLCFTCHVNAEPRNPISFCGYCHSIK